MHERSPTSRSGRFRLLRLALVVVAVATVVYETALNVFLSTGALGRLLSRNPDKLLVTYAAGWSTLPGFVHARGLRIRSKDSQVEFDLRIDRCVFDVALVDLLRRRFHVIRVRGAGISFVGRTRIDPAAATRERLEALPSIEGLEAVPLRGPSQPPPDDAHYRLFTIALDRVDAEAVREVWMNTLRLDGSMRVTGGFFLRPIRRVSVAPVTAFVSAGRLTIGGDTVATDLAGVFETSVDGFDPRVIRGAEVLHRVRAHAALGGRLSAFALLRRAAPRGEATGAATAEVTIDARIDRGRIAPSSRLQASARGLEIDAGPASIRADVDVAVKTGPGASPQPLEGAVTLRRVALTARGFESVPVLADRVDLAVRSADLDLAEHPLSDATLSIRLPAARIADARVVDAWLDQTGGSVRVQGGRGTLGAELDVVGGIGTGRAVLALADARVDVGRNEHISGRLRAELNLRRWSVGGGRLDGSGTRLELADVRATGETANWWAHIDLPSIALALRGAPAWKATMVAQARDIGPLAGALLAAKGLPSWIGPLVSAGPLRAAADIDAKGGSDAVDARATAGPFRLQALVKTSPGASRMLALVGFGAVTVGIESAGAQSHVQISDAAAWYRLRAGGGGATSH